MTSVAVIVGIDGYEGDVPPLTSAVKDALDFRDILLQTGVIAGPQDVRLFTTPPVQNARPATYTNITRELLQLWRGGEAVDRLIFFFSGHGISAYEDGSHTKMCPVILPADVTSLDDDGRNMIDLDELRKYFELNGPKEQWYFIDACRDLNYDHYPSVGRLGWGGGPGAGVQPGEARAQATLWAVAPLYTAEGRRGGNGVMTGHLIEAIRSDRFAVAYDPARGEYVITAESVRAHVEQRVLDAVESEPSWKRKYMVPLLDQSGPGVSPLRVPQQVPDVPFTIHVLPDSAAAATEVRIAIGANILQSYPPRANHQAIPLPPQPYLLTARSRAGKPIPARDVIDVRRFQEATIRIDAETPVPVPAVAPSTGPSSPQVEIQNEVPSFRGLAPDTNVTAGPGRVWAEAKETQVAIELTQLQPPYLAFRGDGSLQVTVPPGPYQIRFRLGPDVFCTQVLYVASGEDLRVRPTVEASPLLMELTGTGDRVREELQVSESIGPMQAGVLTTILPILGIKPFDVKRELFSQFNAAFEGRLRSADEFDGHPFSLVVSLDGNAWQRPVAETLQSIVCEVGPAGLTGPAFLEPLPTSDIHAQTPQASDRVATLVMTAPSRSFLVSLRGSGFDDVQLWCASLPRRATVVTMVLKPDGSADVTQNLLRIPGWNYENEPTAFVSYGKLLRQLQIGQKLYHSGELLRTLDGNKMNSENRMLWQELLYAKWSDPVLSCMAYHAWRWASEQGDPMAQATATWLLPQTARNLRQFFGELPDAQVAYATEFPIEGEGIMRKLIQEDAVPILSVNTLKLGDFAASHGMSDSIVTRVARTLRPNQVWSAPLGQVAKVAGV